MAKPIAAALPVQLDAASQFPLLARRAAPDPPPRRAHCLRLNTLKRRLCCTVTNQTPLTHAPLGSGAALLTFLTLSNRALPTGEVRALLGKAELVFILLPTKNLGMVVQGSGVM